jgi:enoyl-[acyl-carrier-protein] reductase (NADH)
VPGEFRERFDLVKQVPLRRAGEHQELANLAAYLMSDYSAYMNGEVVTIDGGEWLQGAGEFNLFEDVTSEQWDMVEKMVRSAKSE